MKKQNNNEKKMHQKIKVITNQVKLDIQLGFQLKENNLFLPSFTSFLLANWPAIQKKGG